MMEPSSLRKVLIATLFIFAIAPLAEASAQGGSAQDFPARDVTLVVPFPRDGVTDLNARILARHLGKHWGRTIAIVNMPGGGGTTGTMHVLAAPKDGYTMLMSATGQGTQNPAIDSKLPYKWDEPTLVARTSTSPLVFVVRGGSDWNSLRDVISDVKRQPGAFAYGTSGPGGVGILAMSVLFGTQGIDMNKLMRKEMQGGGPLLDAVATGQTHFAAQYLAEMGPQLSSGKLKPLAVSTLKRVKQLPDVPTGAESGFDTFTLIGWNGIAGPAGLPVDVVARWTEALRLLSGNPDYVSETEASGAEVAFLASAQFHEALRAEYETAVRQVTQLGLRK